MNVTSIVDGKPVNDGRTVQSTNPARLSEVVADVVLADAATFAAAAASARRAQPAWADVQRAFTTTPQLIPVQ